MGLREVMAEKSKLVTGVAVVVLVAAGLLVFKNFSGSPGTLDQKWMYDLNADRLVIRSIDTPSPSAGEGTYDYPGLGTGGSLVDAVIFACEDSGGLTEGMSRQEVEATGARIGYLLRYPEGIVKKLEAGQDVPIEVLQGAALMSGPEGDDWFNAEGSKSEVIKGELLSLCGGDLPIQPSP